MSFVVFFHTDLLFLFIETCAKIEMKEHFKQEEEKYKGLAALEQINLLVKNFDITAEDNKKREQIIRKLENWMALSFPNSQLLPFGSCVSGLSCIHSDLDLFLHLPEFGNNLSFG